MSLDMTIGTRSADMLAETDVAVARDIAPAMRNWLQDLTVVAGTAFGVVFASALSVLLFLR
jgi:hypothetical protein